MGLFSSLRKDKQESTADDSEFYSRAEESAEPAPARSRRPRKAASRDAVDPVLPEKKRARRRLIGALALVLAAIIGLPMILDSEPKPLASDIAIQIPSKDSPASSSDSSAGAQADRSSASVDSVAVNEEVDDTARSTDAEVAEASSAAVAVPEKPAPTPVPVPPAVKNKEAAKPPPPPSPPAKNADRALAILAGESPDTAPKASPAREPAAAKFVVQVAALSSQKAVSELQERLKNAGIKSYTQKVATDTGDWIRVRTGPFASQDEADKMRAKLRGLGLNGTLIPA